MGQAGLEPAMPKAPDLQSGGVTNFPTDPDINALSKHMSNLSFDYLPVCAWPGQTQKHLNISWRIWKNKPDASIGLWKLNTPREDFRISFELQKSYLCAVAANSTTTITLGRDEGSWIQTKKSIKTPDLQ